MQKVEKTIDLPLDSDVFRVPSGYNVPQQAHITQGDNEGKRIIVSRVTMYEAGSSTVWYWSENNKHHKNKAKRSVTNYKFYNYTSGLIHHCLIKKLEVN